MFEGQRIAMAKDYKTAGPGHVSIPKGARGVVRCVDRRGRVAVKFDDPFYVAYRMNGTGYTFTAEQAREFLVEDTAAIAA